MSPPSPILASEFHVRRAGKRNSAFLPRFDLPYIPRLFCGLPFVTATGIMRNAASSPFGSQRAVTKDRPGAPILPVEWVATILTPPGSAACSTRPHLCRNRHNSNSDRGWQVSCPASTDLTTGQSKTARATQTGSRRPEQEGRARRAGQHARNKKRAGVFLPVQIRNELCSLLQILDYTSIRRLCA